MKGVDNLKNIISYVLWGTEGRYWGNINYILIANSAIYPEFCSRFYIHQGSIDLPGFKVLKKAQESFPDSVEIEMINEPIVGTKFTNWRLKPLWEDDIGILLCRDLDHITNVPERKAVEYFMQYSTKFVHGIRSYHLHTVPYMAGLCGFRCSLVKKDIKDLATSFQDYLSWAEKNVNYCKQGWIWGCDQALLRDFFGKAGMFPKTLDCPQFTAPLRITNFNSSMIEPSKYKEISIKNCNMDALNYSDSIAPGFTGAPCDATTDQLNEMIKIVNNKMSKMVSDFYDQK